MAGSSRFRPSSEHPAPSPASPPRSLLPQFAGYAEALAQNVCFTGCTGKGGSPGIAKDNDGKNRQLFGKNSPATTVKPPTKGISGTEYAANFADFLNANTENKPWFFWFGCHEPHRAFEHESGVKKGGKKLTNIDKVPRHWPDAPDVRRDLLDWESRPFPHP